MFLKNIKKDQTKNSLLSWRFNEFEAREAVDKSLTQWPLHKQLEEKLHSLENRAYGFNPWREPKTSLAMNIYNEILEKSGKKAAKKYIADLNTELKMAKKPYRYFTHTGFAYAKLESRKTKVTVVYAKKTIKARAFPYLHGFLQASADIKKLARLFLKRFF